MNRKNAFVRFVLTPFAYLYSFVVWFRNRLFDWKILPSVKYDAPVICVGNISVGGTGKTPLTEYLIALLKKQYRIASLSRGYKRQTKGFVWVEADSTALEAGDEACQVKQKFPGVLVAVDGNRRRGIDRLLSLPADERPEVVLLDDAFQHRYVTPSLAIMLTGFHNLYYHDAMLPAGNLRESIRGVRRAGIIVVSKCPGIIRPDDVRMIKNNMKLQAGQRLYFTTVKYDPLKPLFPSLALHPCSLNEIEGDEALLLVTGIANPQPLIDTVKSYSSHFKSCIFPDHHRFTIADIQDIDVEFRKMTSLKKRLITTEKDAMRLKTLTFLPDEWKAALYYLPVSVEFLFDQGEDFDAHIIEHIKIN